MGMLFFALLSLTAVRGTYSLAVGHSEVTTKLTVRANDESGKMTRPAADGENADYQAAARQNHIATRTTTEMKQLRNGYYAVAGVFGEKKNALAFMEALGKNGLHPKSATDPKNHLDYIYLGYYQNGLDAVHAIVSKMGGLYGGKLWILNAREGISVAKVPQKTDAQPSSARPDRSFAREAASKKIPFRSQPLLKGQSSGFYLIAGVFGTKAYALRLVGQTRAAGFKSDLFYDPARKEYYVYLQHFTRGDEALQQAGSGLGDRYGKALWVLEMQASDPSNPQGGERGEQNPVFTGLRKQIAVRHLTKDPPTLAKLIEKADSYFKKMWYAEAAQLYEQALAISESPSYELISKAGDSHYFNTNMERAYYWYDQLFHSYRKDMSADNIFKYAHALKGTGRYARAKRMMRLYNRKLDDGEGSIPEAENASEKREVLLDNILETENRVTVRDLDVNSPYSDFAPMYFQDDQLVFASAADSAFLSTHRYKWNNQPFLDLYVGAINKESQEVRNAVKFSKKINTKYHEAGVTFSPDNQTMYFTRNNYSKKLKRDKNGVNNLKIYRSEKVNGEWTEGVELPFNSDEYSTGHPALSPDGKQLYFVSDMPGSIGSTDIFVVDVHEDGSFSSPRNLGPEINTERKEMFPFINDSKLYFSSDGHVGLGGLDIYEVAFDGANGFLEVRNLGKPINSNRDDFSFIVNEDTQEGYFASNRPGGKGDDDIYYFKRLLPEEHNENAIAGIVTERVAGDKIPDALVELLDENHRKLKELVTGEDGSFLFEDLDSNTKYLLRTSRETYKPLDLPVTTASNQKLEVTVSLDRLEDRIIVEDGIKKLKTDMIYFDFDASKIRPDAAVELNKIVAIMKDHPNMVIKIESHTDSRGPAAYNKYLSDRRAKASREYLLQKGISPARIESAIGYGEEKLLNECDGTVRCSEEAHQKNRRSEFIIVSM